MLTSLLTNYPLPFLYLPFDLNGLAEKVVSRNFLFLLAIQGVLKPVESNDLESLNIKCLLDYMRK